MTRSNSLLLALLLSPLAGACLAPEDMQRDDTVLEQDSLARPLGALARQIVADNLDTDDELNLLARVEVQPDELLEIYEPRPGLLIVSGTGAPARAAKVNPETVHGKTLDELWSELTQDAPMPPELADASQRLSGLVFESSAEADARTSSARTGMSGPQPQADAPSVLTAAPRPQAAPGYCDGQWYTDGYGSCTFGFHFEDDFTSCLDNWWNGAWAAVDDGYYTWSDVCPAQGSVAMRLRTDEGLGGLWTIAQNTHRYTSVLDSNCGSFNDCPWVRVDIEQASGDRFQFRFLSDIE